MSSQTLSSYLPSIILKYLTEQKDDNDNTTSTPPFTQCFNSIALFADVSGFTAMCEAMSRKGNEGDEKKDEDS